MLTLNRSDAANAHILAVAGKIDARTMGEFEGGIREEIGRAHV